MIRFFRLLQGRICRFWPTSTHILSVFFHFGAPRTKNFGLVFDATKVCFNVRMEWRAAGEEKFDILDVFLTQKTHFYKRKPSKIIKFCLGRGRGGERGGNPKWSERDFFYFPKTEIFFLNWNIFSPVCITLQLQMRGVRTRFLFLASPTLNRIPRLKKCLNSFKISAPAAGCAFPVLNSAENFWM